MAPAPPTNLSSNPPTFVFTDIVDSTSLWSLSPPLMYRTLTLHNHILRSLLPLHHGTEIKPLGDGFFLTFPTSKHALAFAMSFQKAVRGTVWPHDILFEQANAAWEVSSGTKRAGRGLAIRIGIHVGNAFIVREGNKEDWWGLGVNIAARMMGQANGGEIAVSDAVLKEIGMEGGDRKKCLERYVAGEGVVRMGGMKKLKGVVGGMWVSLIEMK